LENINQSKDPHRKVMIMMKKKILIGQRDKNMHLFHSFLLKEKTSFLVKKSYSVFSTSIQ